jgi:hypothetical protein
MSRRSKGTRLWLRSARRGKDGKITRRAVWIILDAGKHISTGCAEGEADRAEQVLADHISHKYHPDRRERDLDDIDIADVLSIYLDDCAERHTNQQRFRARIARLNEFWGGLSLAAVTGLHAVATLSTAATQAAHAAILKTCVLLLIITPKRDCTAALCASYCRRKDLRGTAG